ncbi:hypothetical protein KEM55_003652 [Ascosphaera atra]|nr:hypothetical protein KEM55_003652 [Ascosphaera atra]
MPRRTELQRRERRYERLLRFELLSVLLSDDLLGDEGMVPELRAIHALARRQRREAGDSSDIDTTTESENEAAEEEEEEEEEQQQVRGSQREQRRR